MTNREISELIKMYEDLWDSIKTALGESYEKGVRDSIRVIEDSEDNRWYYSFRLSIRDELYELLDKEKGK